MGTTVGADAPPLRAGDAVESRERSSASLGASAPAVHDDPNFCFHAALRAATALSSAFAAGDQK